MRSAQPPASCPFWDWVSCGVPRPLAPHSWPVREHEGLSLCPTHGLSLLCIPSPTTDPWSFHWMLLFFLHYLLLSLAFPKPVFSVKSHFSPGESIPIFSPSFCSKLCWLPSRPAKQLSCCNFLPTANRTLDWNHRFLDPTNSILFYSVFKYH